jgi:dihydrofolate synthase/folylpolyglutamate synthase
MNFKQALAQLEARQESKIKPGLERIRRHLLRLGSPEKNLRVIHIAGTNGKGSVCAILESVLRAAGYRTGFYLSPHLFNIRERVRVQGRWISEKDFALYFSRALKADSERVLSYFELMTSVAFQYFAAEGVDVAVLETGLGGRFDATNVIQRPLASVITSIDYDHMQWLGKTLSSIAFEKAGIIKEGCPVLCPGLHKDALRGISSRARVVKAPLTVVRRPLRVKTVQWKKNRQQLIDGDGKIMNLGLLGERQPMNAALARAVLDAVKAELPVTDAAWRRGLEAVAWPGRFHVLNFKRGIAIVDGAHNPQAARALARTLKASPWSKTRCLWIIGMMKDKDAAAILKPLAPFLSSVVTVAPPSPRALSAMALAREVRRAAPKAHVIVEHDWREALESWLLGKTPQGHPAVQNAVICGSFYLAGRALAVLGVRQ